MAHMIIYTHVFNM